MSEAETYCSDCAWPYECAEKRNCHRRDRGQVRARDYRGELELPPVQCEVRVEGGLGPLADETLREIASSPLISNERGEL